MEDKTQMRVSIYTAPMSRSLLLMVLSLLGTLASAQTRTQDVIYLKSGGAAFTMDVYTPAKPNRAAVVVYGERGLGVGPLYDQELRGRR